MIASPWQKEWNRMQRNEYEFLQNGRLRKESRLNQFLAKKVPEGLQDKLDLAFAKAFEDVEHISGLNMILQDHVLIITAKFLRQFRHAHHDAEGSLRGTVPLIGSGWR